MAYKFFIDYSTRNVAISGEAFVSSAASEEAAKQMVQAAMPKARLRVKGELPTSDRPDGNCANGACR